MAHASRTDPPKAASWDAENSHPSRAAGLAALHSTTQEERSGRPCLEALSVGTLQNVRRPHPHPHQHQHAQQTTPRHKATASAPGHEATPDSLAEDLNNFHIHSPAHPGKQSAVQTGRQHAIHHARSAPHLASPAPNPIPASPTAPPLQKSAQTSKHAHFALPAPEPRGTATGSLGDVGDPDSHRAGSTDTRSQGPVQHDTFSDLLAEPGIQDAIERHDARHFDWILSLPRDACGLVKGKHLRRTGSAADLADSACQSRKVYFGCNLLRQRSLSRGSETGQDRAGSTYTLIATPLSHATASARSAAAGPMIETLVAPGAAAPVAAERAQSIPRSPCSSVSRIEDTIEELDRLEDQFEAVNRMVRVDRVPSPDKEAHGRRAAAPGAAAGARQNAKTSTLGAARRPDLARAASVRRSVTIAPDPLKNAADAPRAGSTAGAKRLSVARPLSLLPPKPPARSAKPPTRPTFELPGEAVARRLKEQREARMATAAAAAAAAASPKAAAASHAAQLRRTQSVRLPTIPTFELPGEAISRRKREEHEAKLRRQDEEERKRREFKARPIRLSITPSTLPRDTVASRARQNRMSMLGDSPAPGGRLSVPGSGPAAGNARLSASSAESAARAGSQAQAARGRDPTLGSLSSGCGPLSRATSTSTGSVSGKRSTVSAEDVQQQRLRGKEILQRDSMLAADRDREKRERETAAKQARQEAAERSRMLSREWAEKQKLKAKKAVPARR